MGNFLVSYASRVVIYDHRAFIRLATGFRDTLCNLCKCKFSCSLFLPAAIMIFILYFLMGHPRPLLRLFSFFQKQYNFCYNYTRKYVYPAYYGAGIQTHDLQNMILLPQPLDQGKAPIYYLILYLRSDSDKPRTLFQSQICPSFGSWSTWGRQL